MRKEVKFQYMFQRLYVYEENIEIKSIFKSETIKKSQIKGTKISGLGTKIDIHVDGHKDVDFSLFDTKKIKDIYKHLNNDLTFEELYEKYTLKATDLTQSPLFSKMSAKIFGVLLLFFGFVTLFSNFLSGLLIFIAGLIIFPKTNSLLKEKTKLSITKKNRIIIGSSLLLIAMIILSNSGDSSSVVENTKVSKQAETVAEQENVKVVFDIPYLLDKNISYFTDNFGDPVNDNPEPTEIAIQTNSDDTWSKSFEKNGYMINVLYNTSNGSVEDIFLYNGTYKQSFIGESHVTKSGLEKLMKVGNLSKSSQDYYIRSYEVPNKKGTYTGWEVQREPFTGFKGDVLCSGYPNC
jgi:hypothetical protein